MIPQHMYFYSLTWSLGFLPIFGVMALFSVCFCKRRTSLVHEQSGRKGGNVPSPSAHVGRVSGRLGEDVDAQDVSQTQQVAQDPIEIEQDQMDDYYKQLVETEAAGREKPIQPPISLTKSRHKQAAFMGLLMSLNFVLIFCANPVLCFLPR